MKFLKAKALQLLRWSERYTKTDMVYLARGGALFGFGEVISASAGLITALIFANFLPKEVYGTYRFVLSMTALLSITTLSGMGVAVTRSVARGFDGTMDKAMREKFRWGLLGVVASCVLMVYYYTHGNTLLAGAFLIVALFMPVMESFGVYDSFLQGKREFGVSLRYLVLSKTLSVTALILTVFFTDDILFLLLAYFVPFTVCRLIFFLQARRLYATNDAHEEGTSIFGKHLSVMGILGVIASHLDKLLVFNLLGAAELAVYAIISTPVDQIKAFVDSISKIALPKFAQQSGQNIRTTIWRRMSLLMIGLVGLSLAYWLVAPFLFDVIFSHYTEYVFLSQIFGISIISFALFIPLQILQGRQETKQLYVINTVTPLIQIALSVVAVVSYGLIGVVLARVVARIINVSIFLIALRFNLRKQ